VKANEGALRAPGSPWHYVALALAAAAFGFAVGILGGAFRWVLRWADVHRTSLVIHAHHSGPLAWLAPVALVAAGAAFGRWVVRVVPRAAGSGIQSVEAVWRGELEPSPGTVVPAKFAGGAAAIGAGLALGREGPTVHMGAVLGATLGRVARLATTSRRALGTALGGAGLAVAFNAPLGGSLFAFEEVAKVFDAELTVAVLIGTSVAVATSWTIVGNQPVYPVAGHIAAPSFGMLGAFVLFGAATAFLGVVYNVLILRGLHLFNRFARPAPEVRAAVVGAMVGVLLWFQPTWAGGGDGLILRALGTGWTLGPLLALLAIRFVLGPVSYSVGAPGGLFAPLLVVGATWGTLASHWMAWAQPGHPAGGTTFAVVGMATFFAAVVRAPLTGIALTVEMTTATSLVVPMFAACFAAVLVANALRSEPIYDSLRRLTLLGAS